MSLMTSLYRTYDYSQIPIAQIADNDKYELSKISNVTIKELCSGDNPNLLIFPHQLDEYKDGIADSYICKIDQYGLQTGDLMGFVGVNECQLTIASRFSKHDEEDFFLHYMLQKVFNINMLDLQHSMSNNRVFDFLAYMFPYYLKRALRQGLYKKYVSRKCNNANIKGRIDIPLHIKYNNPFIGRVAYNVREYSYDNELTQLIRHTIEYIRGTHMNSVLKADADTEMCVLQICNNTQSYNLRDLPSIINKNRKTVNHSFYTEYRLLQKICMQILQHKRLKYGVENDKIYGLLFSGSWLWEEFLFKSILSDCGFKHPQNRAGKGGIYLFDKSGYGFEIANSRCKRYPDYFKENFILDAKYKHLDSNHIDRDDMHQVIAYMYVEEARIGGFIYPSVKDTTQVVQLGVLRGYAGRMYNIGVSIPKSQQTYRDFVEKMGANIEQLKNYILDLSS